jgi:hypothetical protein
MIMKKILLLAVVMFASLNASAQFYVGGSVGFGSVKPTGGSDSEFTFRILPEFGYNLNDDWAIGIILGYQKGFPFEGQNLGKGDFNTQYQYSKTEIFQISPYARYTAIGWDQVKLFFDGGITFGSFKDAGTLFSLGIRPGLAINLTDELSFVTHIGFLGFENYSPKGEGKSGNNFGLDLSNSCSFGVYYNF